MQRLVVLHAHSSSGLLTNCARTAADASNEREWSWCAWQRICVHMCTPSTWDFRGIFGPMIAV